VNTLLNDRDEDIDDRQDLRHRQYNNGRDREITLGTTMILGIFFALAVLCAAFFGFGYSTGRHSALTSLPAAGANTTSNGILKPGAGTTASNPYNAQSIQLGDTPAFGIPVAHTPPPEPVPTKPAYTPASAPAPERVVATDPYVPPPAPAGAPLKPKAIPVAAIVSAPAPVTVAPAAPSAPGSFMVQVAAVSHQEDGELLVTSLKRRGYNVAIHNEPQDKLLHVQIGPFSNRKEADIMRQRLLGDGFNAIVK
jgi:DedD protein